MTGPVLHILNTNTSQSATLCGVIGGTTYNPAKSDCPDCIDKFNKLYPGSMEAWLKKETK